MYCTVLYCTVLYCTVLYCTVLYCTVLYCTTSHNSRLDHLDHDMSGDLWNISRWRGFSTIASVNHCTSHPLHLINHCIRSTIASVNRCIYRWNRIILYYSSVLQHHWFYIHQICLRGEAPQPLHQCFVFIWKMFKSSIAMAENAFISWEVWGRFLSPRTSSLQAACAVNSVLLRLRATGCVVFP